MISRFICNYWDDLRTATRFGKQEVQCNISSSAQHSREGGWPTSAACLGNVGKLCQVEGEEGNSWEEPESS